MTLVAMNDAVEGIGERLRVVFVIDIVENWRGGGTEQQLVRLINGLNPRYFDPVVVVLQACSGAHAEDLQCPVVTLKLERGSSRLGTLHKLMRVLLRVRPHMVQTFFIDGLYYGTLAAHLTGVPIVVQSRRNAGYWQKFYHTLALRAMNPMVDAWQCNSRHVAELLEKKEGIPRDRISVLPNAIDLAHFCSASPEQRRVARQNLGVLPDVPLLVAVSNLRPVKGLSCLLRAAVAIKHRIPEAKFLIVGEGPLRADLADLIRQLELGNTVRLEGAQSDVRPWLAAADIGILASESESSSNAVLEYMAMALPTVLSDIPANRELAQGTFFPPGDAEALADRIVWLWERPEVRAVMGEQNRAAVAHCDCKIAAQRTQNYYLKLASQKIPEFRNMVPDFASS